MQSRWYAHPSKLPRQTNLLLLLLAFFQSILGASSALAAGESLELRNTSPLAQLYGVPAMRGAIATDVELRFDVGVASSFTGDFNATEFVFLDGETAVFSYTVRRPLGARFEAGVELPWVVHSGGRFDGLIDEFHDLFGLPDGGRPLVPRGQLDYVVRANGVTDVDIQGKTSALGDVRGWLAYALLDTPGRSLTARAHAKLPTGRASKLSGSGAFDGAIALEYVDANIFSSLGVQLTAGGGLTVLGDGDILTEKQDSVVPFGHFGLGVQVGKHARFLGQLDAHGAIFDSQLSHLGNSVLQGSLGVQYSATPKLNIEFSLIEDLSGAMAADVIFKLTVSGRL